ncbi:MAG TPA: DUF1552 domain-containing protein, partial [Myxococcota bacterium]|nr:DUF1552 domain-containing protein [Myxococcota bacterium]
KGAGAALALPWLEASGGEAPAPPTRFVVCSAGFSLGVEKSTLPEMLLPLGVGPGYGLSTELEPLGDLAREVTVVSGLSIPGSRADGSVPPGGRHTNEDGFHHHYNPLLAGRAQIGDERDDTVTDRSSDEIAADAWAGQTMMRSVNYRAQVDPYLYDAVPAYGYLSYRRVADRILPVEPQTSPRQAWLALTGAFVPSEPALAEARLRDLERRRSVLDAVDRRMAGFVDRLGARDRDRLQRHFDEVRDLERRLASPAMADATGCAAPADPGLDPEIDLGGWSDEDTRARLFNELLRFALSCRLTRVGALAYTHWKTYLKTLPIAGFDWTIHDVLHHGVRDQLVPLARWHVDLWADLLRRLKETPEGEGNLLDHCAVVFLPEGGYGQSPGVTSEQLTSHSCERMILMTAGGAGGLVRGRHLIATPDANHPGNVLLTALRAAGLDVSAIGDVTGEVQGLRG